MPPKSTLIESTWISSEAACERLRVRPQTLYAYVSRGLLHPRKDERRSWYDLREVDALAATGRRRSRSGRLEVLIDTEVTLLDPDGRLAYRGIDVDDLVGRWSFERTAQWLWSGDDDGEPAPWPAASEIIAFGDRPGDRVRSASAVLAATAPPSDRRLDAVRTVGPRLIASLVAALPPMAEPAVDEGRIAARLWSRVSPIAPTAARLRALDATLVLLADHELAASTVAARVAASVWCAPLDVVAAAMATHSGALHGGALSMAEDQLRAGGPITLGFGHPIYRTQDPRARLLLPLVEAACPARAWSPLATRLGSGELPPNADLVVAALSVGCRMVPGAGEAIFAIARSVGCLAHAAEEYRNPFRFRPRASYTGPPPR